MAFIGNTNALYADFRVILMEDNRALPAPVQASVGTENLEIGSLIWPIRGAILTNYLESAGISVQRSRCNRARW
jgi:hypothetical protein